MEPARPILTVNAGSGAWRRGIVAWRLLRTPGCPLLVVRDGATAQLSYQRVLVAVDGSPTSVACLAKARELAPSADMAVVHALDDSQEKVSLRERLPEEQIEARRIQHHEQAVDRLDLLLADAAIPPHETVRIVENAYAPQLILETAWHFRADLLVVGLSSAPWLRRVFFRPVAPQVLARSPCDVLLVPAVSSNIEHQ